MPTGYTAKIEEGISFEEYAAQCARAFLVKLRDEPLSTKIPERLPVSDHHLEELKEAEKELTRLQKMTTSEAKIMADKEFEKESKKNLETIRKKRALKEKYDEMLNKVRAWAEPSPAHAPLKKFMEDQILTVIEWDCNTDYEMGNKPVHFSGKRWLEGRIKEVTEDVKYHTKQYQDEVTKVTQTNLWISQLRASLNRSQYKKRNKA